MRKSRKFYRYCDLDNISCDTHLSMAWTKAKGSIRTTPPFHCFRLVHDGWRLRSHWKKKFRLALPLMKIMFICIYYYQAAKMLSRKLCKCIARYLHRYIFLLWWRATESLRWQSFHKLLDVAVFTMSWWVLKNLSAEVAGRAGRSCTRTGNCSRCDTHAFTLHTSEANAPPPLLPNTNGPPLSFHSLKLERTLNYTQKQ